MIPSLIAECVSFVLGGPLMLFLLVFIILESHLTDGQLTILLPLFLIFQFLIPFGHLLIAYKNKQVKNLDITNRKERLMPLLVTLITYICSAIIAYFLGNSLLLQLTVLVVILLAVNALVTLFWKISLHMALNTSAVLLINILSHWQFVWLLVCIPLVFWSRLSLKKHSVAQLIAGFVLNTAVIFLYMYYIRFSAP